MGKLDLVALEATLAQPILQRPRGDADTDHLHVNRRPVEALRGRGDESGVGQVGAEGCVEHHGATKAEIGPGDVEQRVVLERQDAVAVERVGLAVARVVPGRRQGGLDEPRAHRILVEVRGAVLAGEALRDRRLAGARRANDDVQGRRAHPRASRTAVRKSRAAAVTRVKSRSGCHALVTALPTPTPATPAANHSFTFSTVTPPAGMTGTCASGASTALA